MTKRRAAWVRLVASGVEQGGLRASGCGLMPKLDGINSGAPPCDYKVERGRPRTGRVRDGINSRRRRNYNPERGRTPQVGCVELDQREGLMVPMTHPTTPGRGSQRGLEGH
jgi:hypothetical protein